MHRLSPGLGFGKKKKRARGRIREIIICFCLVTIIKYSAVYLIYPLKSIEKYIYIYNRYGLCKEISVIKYILSLD
jgi:type IV secretory pathway component VirB8